MEQGMSNSLSPEVVTLGETMLRFSPEQFVRLEQTSRFEVHVGGSESNTAVGLARLGHRVSWISRLTDVPMGRKVTNAISALGVDCSQVVWTQSDRVGTYYMERGAGPRSSQVFYDRANSAAANMSVADVSVNWFRSEGNARPPLFHTTGITLGISQSAKQAAFEALRKAKERGCRTTFDINYRAKLWSAEDAANSCDQFAKECDFVLLPIRDAETLYGVNGSPEETCLSLRNRWPESTIVLTLGSHGSCVLSREAEFFHQEAFSTREVERLGSGDAFSAGFIGGLLRNLPLQDCLKFGNAAAAIKYTIPGDLPVFDREVVEALAFGESDSLGIQR